MNKIYSLILNAYNLLLDLVFPKTCVGCGIEGYFLCPNCKKEIILIKNQICPECKSISPNGKFCAKCQKKFKLNGVISASYYQEGPLKEAIHTFKYDGVFGLGQDLGAIFFNTFKNHKISKNSVLIAVPLSKKRFAKRGFNQAEILADFISKKTKIPQIKKLLIKVKNTPKNQAELSGVARRKNVIGVFDWVGDNNFLKGKTVYLVDDIYTTGATLNECAKILKKKAGAFRVIGLVLAKA